MAHRDSPVPAAVAELMEEVRPPTQLFPRGDAALPSQVTVYLPMTVYLLVAVYPSGGSLPF